MIRRAFRSDLLIGRGAIALLLLFLTFCALEREISSMPLFWRGAPVGSYWHSNDAQHSGFTAHSPGMLASVDRMIQHISLGTAASPFISLTRSYAVAWAYAVHLSGTSATSSNPAYVYEVELEHPLPRGLVLLDPINELSTDRSDPLNGCPYHHNGLPTFLLGVVHPTMAAHLNVYPPCPPVGGVSVSSRLPNQSDELKTLVNVLRDAEVLAIGAIPASKIVKRYDVF